MQQRVRDFMTHKPMTVRDDTAAAEALGLMVEQGIRHLPVLGARRELIGILSIDDLRAALPFEVSRKRPLGPQERSQARSFRVSDAMTWAPLTVEPGALLEDAARSLARNRIGCLPVVEDGELVGVLSETDALRALASLLSREAPGAAAGAGESESLLDALRSERIRLAEQLVKWQQAERALSAEPGEDPSSAAVLEPLSARAARRLRAIEQALERAEHGRFGICERCHAHIPATRLRAVPEATLCMRCASPDAGTRGDES